MGGNGKLRRWRISFHRSHSGTGTGTGTGELPPSEFICPITNSLMFDPVVVSSGQTFERISVQVCKDLSFTPTLSDNSSPDFSAVIPNLALKTTILNWCKKSGSGRPNPPIYSDIESIVTSKMLSSSSSNSSNRELLKGVSENPNILFSHADTELNPRNTYSSSSSDESVIANGTPNLPFETRPSCFSYSSSPSNSSEFVTASDSSTSSDERYINKMNSLDIYEQEQAVILLRKNTKVDEEARSDLCTEKLLLALKQLLISRYAAVQTNAMASLVNLSLHKVNKVKIVRAGIVPILIDVLKNGFDESKDHAAGAIFSLSLEEENRTAIGVLGALPPLLLILRSGSRRSRHDAALALYHLTLVGSNRSKILKLGAVGFLLGLLTDADVAARVVLVVCNLAASEEGRAALLDSGGVERLVNVLREHMGSVSVMENCVAALHSISYGSLRFKVVAVESGAVDVLRKIVANGSERAREKAKRILEVLRGRDEEEEEVDWEAVMKVGVGNAGYRVGKSHGTNSTEF